MAKRPTPKMGVYERPMGARRWKRQFPYASGSRDSMARAFQAWLIACPSGTERAIRKIPRPRKKD